MSCKTADFVEFRAGATEPKHCVTESLAQHRRSEEEEEGEAQVGAEEISFGRTESETTPAFYAQDAALGWRLCHLGLEGTFSHKRANKRNVSPPRMHSSESECGRHFLWEGGLQLEEFSGQRLYTPSTRAVKLRRALVYFSQEGPGR